MIYKLIACDLDETLLNDDHLCPQINIDAIKKAREEYGVKFVPATGRGYSQIVTELKTLDLYDLPEEYVLSYNGGALTENKDNKILAFKGLDYFKMAELFQYGITVDVCIHVYTLDGLYIFNMSDSEYARLTKQKVDYQNITVNDVSFLKDAAICKILYQNTDTDYLKSLEPFVEDIVKDCVSVSYSSNRYMEFNQLGVDKGQGLKDLAKLLNIPMEQTIAIGDNYNDQAMLEVAGLSVAANNAVQDMKDICDYVTKANNNEGVVAEAIRKYIFNENI